MVEDYCHTQTEEKQGTNTKSFRWRDVFVNCRRSGLATQMGRVSHSNGWRRAEKAQMGIYTKARLQYRGSISSPLGKWQPVPCWTRRERTECRNITANTGRWRSIGLVDKSYGKEVEQGGGVGFEHVREEDRLGRNISNLGLIGCRRLIT